MSKVWIPPPTLKQKAAEALKTVKRLIIGGLYVEEEQEEDSAFAEDYNDNESNVKPGVETRSQKMRRKM